MSKSVPGTGQLRKTLIQLGETIFQSVMDYEKIAFTNEATTRNNLDTSSAERGIEIWKEVERVAKRCDSMLAHAYMHHSSQTSVLPNNIFGQRRRIQGGETKVIDQLDPVKLAQRWNVDGFNNLNPQQQSIYMSRGRDPHPDFQDWDAQKQRAYLIGQFTP